MVIHSAQLLGRKENATLHQELVEFKFLQDTVIVGVKALQVTQLQSLFQCKEFNFSISQRINICKTLEDIVVCMKFTYLDG